MQATPQKAKSEALARGHVGQAVEACQEDFRKALPPCKAPPLGEKEWLEDDHLSYVINALLDPVDRPPHVWLATPTQVVLLSFGDAEDPQAERDGGLSMLFDREDVRLLLLPITSDPLAGRSADAGSHWSVLAVRRTVDGAANAQLHDSLSAVPTGANKTAQGLLKQLGASKHWKAVPRRPQLLPHGLQRDKYQCGIYCLLMLKHLLEAERGNAKSEAPLTPARYRRRAARLRSSIQELQAEAAEAEQATRASKAGA